MSDTERAVAALDFSPSADNNKHPILETLFTRLAPQRRPHPEGGDGGRACLEIAAGTGQHAVWFGRHLPGWRWVPTEYAADAIPGIAARLALEGPPNVLPPRRLDVTADPATWLLPDPQAPQPEPSAQVALPAVFDLVFCANMLHIAPWDACGGLMRGAARWLARPSGILVVYGAFLEDSVATAPSNVAFDVSLRSRDARWGVRRREDVEAEAASCGLALLERHEMPCNNLLLVFGFAGGASEGASSAL